jgi:hypothetical protein
MSDEELIAEIRLRWNKLYQSVQNGEIPTPEYAKRRRVYENMIWEIEQNKEE